MRHVQKSPVFRIGGDEFCVILQNRDLADMEKLFAQVDAECAATYVDPDNARIPVRIARGFARFDPKTDTCFSDVFARADHEMYENKKIMKAANQ